MPLLLLKPLTVYGFDCGYIVRLWIYPYTIHVVVFIHFKSTLIFHLIHTTTSWSRKGQILGSPFYDTENWGSWGLSNLSMDTWIVNNSTTTTISRFWYKFFPRTTTLILYLSFSQSVIFEAHGLFLFFEGFWEKSVVLLKWYCPSKWASISLTDVVLSLFWMFLLIACILGFSNPCQILR